MGKPDIIYEDNDIIVCYKPAGIATQTRRIGQQDMESFIRNYRAAKNEPPYVGIVHRLDQPVEGVMVFAKNQKAAASLSRQIKEHTTEKYYHAASRGQGVSGAAVEDEEESFQDKSAYASKVPGDDKKEDIHDPAWHTLTDYISFDKRTNTSKITSEKDRLAKKAVLQYRILSNECNKTEFDIKLLTGRHHQIRLQLANIGYPLIGDTKYGGETVMEQLALCSYKLVFDHPATGERMTFELP